MIIMRILGHQKQLFVKINSKKRQSPKSQTVFQRFYRYRLRNTSSCRIIEKDDTSTLKILRGEYQPHPNKK